MNKDLERYSAVAQAITALLYPHAEVVIHDFKTGQIAALFNSFSKRKIGDESLLEELQSLSQQPDVYPPYCKTNWDGKRLKSTTATIRDSKGKPVGCLCINLDVSKWEELHRFALEMIQVGRDEGKPEVLFKDDWRDKINAYVADYLKREGTLLKALSREKKQELVRALHREGAFQAKNAASYAADVLEISRATIYNYLR